MCWSDIRHLRIFDFMLVRVDFNSRLRLRTLIDAISAVRSTFQNRDLNIAYPDEGLGLNSTASALSGCAAGTGVEALGVMAEFAKGFSCPLRNA